MVRSSVAAAVIVKLPADMAVPPGVVTVIFPLVAPLATTAVICVALFTAKLEAAVPLMATAVAPVKLLPVITMELPADPLPGLKLEIAGAATVILKFVLDVVVPAGVVTAMTPVVVPLAIVAVICVALFTVKLAAALPLKVTAVAPVKSVPVITTETPTAPVVGLKVDMAGGKVMAKLPDDAPVPLEVVTLIFPVVEPLATTAVIVVALVTEKLEAAFAPNVTAVAPVRFVPVMVTVVPATPEAGAKLVMEGAGVTVCDVEPAPPHALKASESARIKAKLAR